MIITHIRQIINTMPMWNINLKYLGTAQAFHSYLTKPEIVQKKYNQAYLCIP